MQTKPNNWDTEEICLHLANDEGLYNETLDILSQYQQPLTKMGRIELGKELRGLTFGLIPGVAYNKVNWQAVADYAYEMSQD